MHLHPHLFYSNNWYDRVDDAFHLGRQNSLIMKLFSPLFTPERQKAASECSSFLSIYMISHIDTKLFELIELYYALC